ncbi:hypothetical protein B0H65DRAFT_562948 [Neurospora tetraspora]|uniref:Uncharacterized protein n=1 Tax=Neurospora tetraspora TaxID=94610 RepID=A0AAE0JNI3_9PEZI|nr:hypothetical protein B0H65DRAFT_562948 [Neurospora tetraspora]
MCLEKRKLYTVCGHQSSGIRPCHRQRQLLDDPEGQASPSTPFSSGSGALASKICCCPRLTSLIAPQTQPASCRPPHPYFTETRFGFCCRCQAYYRSSGFATSESDTRDDQDVGGGIQKLEDIRWKTIMWAEEGRKRREWRGELEEREKEWEKEERGEEEDERRDLQSGTGHQLDAATEADEVKPVTNRALISSYHNVLARLAASTSEHQSSLSRSHSQETDLTHVNIGEHDNDEHGRLIDDSISVEQNDTTNTADLQPESSISSVEDLYNYDYHQLSEILEERSSQYTKSRPITAAGQSPVLRKKTGLSPVGQSTTNFSRPLTRSNLARLHESQESEEEDKTPNTSTVQATIRPPNTPTPFSMAAGVNMTDNNLGNFTNSTPCSESQSLHLSRREQPADSQTTSVVTATVQAQPSPSGNTPSGPPPSNAPPPITNAATHSIQSWENFTISTPSQQSIHSSWREPTEPNTERGKNGSRGSVTLSLNQPILTTTSPNTSSGRSTPRLRRTPRLQGQGTPRLQALNEDIYLRPEQVDDGSGSGLAASVFGELSAGIVEKEDEEGKGKEGEKEG